MRDSGGVNDNTGDDLSKAIAVMTAWHSGSELEHQQFTAQTANDMMDAGEGPLDLISGFITLTAWLLTRIESSTGAIRASGGRRFRPAVTELRIDPPGRKGRVTVTMNWHCANTTVDDARSRRVGASPAVDAVLLGCDRGRSLGAEPQRAGFPTDEDLVGGGFGVGVVVEHMTRLDLGL